MSDSAAWSDGLDDEDIEVMQIDANEGLGAAIAEAERLARIKENERHA